MKKLSSIQATNAVYGFKVIYLLLSKKKIFEDLYHIYVILTPLAPDLWRILRNLDSNVPIISEKMIENGDKTPATQGSLPILQAHL